MEQLSSYEIAQKRIQERRKRNNRLNLWIILLILTVVVTLLEATQIGSCSLPIMLGLGVFIFLDGSELYFTSLQHELSPEVFEQEMTWLFGDDWRETTGTQQYMLAQDRIRRRKIRRGEFYAHLFVSIILNTGLLWLLFTPPNYGSIQGLGITVVSCAILIVHGTKVFPSQQQLEYRERKIGQAIQAEIDRSIPESSRYKEKPKRDVQYRIGEDGELEEISEYSEDEKPKRDVL